MLNKIFKINEYINDKVYNISMQKKLKGILNTSDGVEILEWLAKTHLLNTHTISMDKNKMYYEAGRNDFIKWLLVIANYEINNLKDK